MTSGEQIAVLDRDPKITERHRANGQQADTIALQKAFEAEDWNGVQSFIQARPQLATLLLEAKSLIQKIFGPDVLVRLNVVPDYEDNAEFLLFADIQTHDSALVAFDKMNLFESEWWLDAAPKAEGLLHFSVEFA